MANSWVLKLPQVDAPEQPILVHITQKHGLDLDLLATDGEAAYRGKVRERNCNKLKADNFNGTNDQWASILRYALISKQSSDIDQDQKDNLEVQCSISGSKSKRSLSITFRTRIENITSRLGAIELAYSEDTDDVDLFRWTCQTIETRDRLDAEVSLRSTESAQLQDRITALEKELTDLVEAKRDYDEQMLAKFTLLLNEKKSKIRNQQRILEAAKIDPKKVEELQLTMEGDQLHGRSDRSKRKAKTANVDDEDESDGFDSMDVDDRPPARVNDGHDESEEELEGAVTGSESEDDRDLDEATGGALAQRQKDSAKNVSPPPPPRALPFKRKEEKAKGTPKGTEQRATTTKHDADDDEGEHTASEDDEL